MNEPQDNILLSKIEVYDDQKWGASIRLIDFEHLDYIRDVLGDVFDVGYEFHIADDEAENYILHFCDEADLATVKKAAAQINDYHKSTGKLYETL